MAKSSTEYLKSLGIVYHSTDIDECKSNYVEMVENGDGDLNRYVFYVEGGYNVALGLLSIDDESSRNVVLNRVYRVASVLFFFNSSVEGIEDIIYKYVEMVVYESNPTYRDSGSIPYYGAVKETIEKAIEEVCSDEEYNPYEVRYIAYKIDGIKASKEKRREECNRILGYVYKQKNIANIYQMVDLAMEEGEFVTKGLIQYMLRGMLGLEISKSTLDRYWGYVKDKVDSYNERYYGYLNENEKKKYDTIDQIHSAGVRIHFEQRRLINKYRIHKESGKTRKTIDKHWALVDADFAHLNSKLNLN